MITLEDLRNWLGITTADEDILLEAARLSAQDEVREFCARSFEKQDEASARRFWPVHKRLVWIDDVWDDTGAVVKVDTNDDGTFDDTWDASSWMLAPVNQTVDGRAWPYTELRAVDGDTFPTSHKRPPVEVTAKWGWSAVPQPVKQATLILAAETYKLKDAPFGVAGFDQFGSVRVRDIPQVHRMLTRYAKEQVRF